MTTRTATFTIALTAQGGIAATNVAYSDPNAHEGRTQINEVTAGDFFIFTAPPDADFTTLTLSAEEGVDVKSLFGVDSVQLGTLYTVADAAIGSDFTFLAATTAADPPTVGHIRVA